jgi:1-deoxy-D-xylulose-5-phosphate synthase
VVEFAKNLEESAKNLFSEGMLFEELGFRYFGPIEGHDLKKLTETFAFVRDLTGPRVIHVLTEKGKGFAFAENNREKWHGLAAYDPVTGEARKKASGPPTWTQVFGEALTALAADHPDFVVITAAMPSGTGTNIFEKRWPGRFFDVGIAEGHAVTFAGGLATQGIRPVAAIYSTFLQRAYDQVIHDVCVQKLPVTFALDRGGLVGADGATHQGAYDLAYLRIVPNMVVMAPADENEMRHMLATAISVDGPAAVRFPRGNGVGVPLDSDLKILPIGKGRVVYGDGAKADVLIAAVGTLVHPARAAAARLADAGIRAVVVDARFVKPLDEDLICGLAQKIGKVVTAEEAMLAGGFGSAVLEALERRGVTKVAVRRLGLPDLMIEHGDPQKQRARYSLDEAGIVNAAAELCRGDGRLLTAG